MRVLIINIVVIICCLATINSLDISQFGESFDPAVEVMKGLYAKIEDLKSVVGRLAVQTMAQQTFVEERIRSDGHSGLKQVRGYHHGTSPYFSDTHIGRALAATHDHPDNEDTIGFGETIVVLNGVEFRSRHNDYRLKRPHSRNKTYHATEDISFPKVPRSVNKKTTVEAQSEEMREYFRAFQEQDSSIRNYKEYFKPVLCYMEGSWGVPGEMDQMFDSDRHKLVADSWDQLLEQVRFTSYTGGKDPKENYAFLPRAIMEVDPISGLPAYAQWNYRILCHPISFDIPTRFFRLQDDLAYREASRKSRARVSSMRAARYRLEEPDYPTYTNWTILDDIMSEIPGLDNVPEFLNEASTPHQKYSVKFPNLTLLNTGFYHRMYQTDKPGAMGELLVKRGFSDELLFVAETTQEKVAGMPFTRCQSKRLCDTQYVKYSYAIPLEVIYLTPLLSWNPYGLYMQETLNRATKNGTLNGQFDTPLDGTARINGFYRTPPYFYSGEQSDEKDKADTSRDVKYVLDPSGKKKAVSASGIRTVTFPIPGVGPVRLRYPIMPIHGEGSSVWKELNVLKKHVATLEALAGPDREKVYEMMLEKTGDTEKSHTHKLFVLGQQYDELINGLPVVVQTQLTNGHRHTLLLVLDKELQKIVYTECDGRGNCHDHHHPKAVTILRHPPDCAADLCPHKDT